MVLRKEQCAEWKKIPLLYCCNQVWIKIAWQILWNVTPICETSQIYFLMGRRPMKDALDHHSKDPLFHLVHWLSITLLLRRISQNSINLERKSYLDCSSDTLFYAGGIWKGDVLVPDLEELETMDASEIYSKRLNAEEVIFPEENLFFQSQMDESKPLDWYGIDQFEEKVTLIFLENQKGPFHNLTTPLVSGCRWSAKWLVVHPKKLHLPPSRWTPSQTVLAERGITPCSTKIHCRIQN